MSRIVIFGGQGYLGKNMIMGLQNHHDLLTLDRDVSKRFSYLDYTHLHLDHPGLAERLNNFEPEVFVISYFGNPREKSIEAYQLLSDYIFELIDKINSSPRVVFFSSQLVYGNTPDKYKAEGAPVQPVEFYAIQCRLMEERIKSAYQGRFLVMRVPVVYGGLEVEKGYKNIISIFQNLARLGSKISVFGEGQNVRSIVHIEDMMVLFESILINHRELSLVNCCFGEYYSILELASFVCERYQGSFVKTPRLANSEVLEYDVRLDSSLACSIVNPRHDFHSYLSSDG